MNDTSIDHLAYDPELEPGATNAIEVCLGLRGGERVTLITDRITVEIAASLLAAARRVGCRVESFVLEDEASRPLHDMPGRILAAAAGSEAVISCFHPQAGEIGSRRELIELMEAAHIRYAHMVWITSQIMCQSMRADYRVIDALGERVLERMRPAYEVVVKSPAGTDIEARFDPALTWIKTSGIISPDYWSNLPGGEVWTAPADVNGVFVADGAVGDYLCSKYGDLSATPLTLEIESNRLRSAASPNQSLASDFAAYCMTADNSDRVGEFALGTNIGISEMIGNLLQDEKVPGVHIAFGDPCANLTGADWTAFTHIDAISRACDVWVDGNQIMAGGRYLI